MWPLSEKTSDSGGFGLDDADRDDHVQGHELDKKLQQVPRHDACVCPLSQG